MNVFFRNYLVHVFLWIACTLGTCLCSSNHHECHGNGQHKCTTTPASAIVKTTSKGPTATSANTMAPTPDNLPLTTSDLQKEPESKTTVMPTRFTTTASLTTISDYSAITTPTNVAQNTTAWTPYSKSPTVAAAITSDGRSTLTPQTIQHVGYNMGSENGPSGTSTTIIIASVTSGVVGVIAIIVIVIFLFLRRRRRRPRLNGDGKREFVFDNGVYDPTVMQHNPELEGKQGIPGDYAHDCDSGYADIDETDHKRAVSTAVNTSGDDYNHLDSMEPNVLPHCPSDYGYPTDLQSTDDYHHITLQWSAGKHPKDPSFVYIGALKTHKNGATSDCTTKVDCTYDHLNSGVRNPPATSVDYATVTPEVNYNPIPSKINATKSDRSNFLYSETDTYYHIRNSGNNQGSTSFKPVKDKATNSYSYATVPQAKWNNGQHDQIEH